MNEELLLFAKRLLTERERVLLALDGGSGAGKTSAAALLKDVLGAAVVHMDDFFLPSHRKTADRLAQPGGNVDYERVEAEVLAPYRRGEVVCLRRYDCRTGRLLPPTALPFARLTVVEGVYSCHPALRGYYDAAVFLRVSPEEQRHRVQRREGAAQWTQFEREWIPLEDRYFAACGVADFCDLVLSSPKMRE